MLILKLWLESYNTVKKVRNSRRVYFVLNMGVTKMLSYVNFTLFREIDKFKLVLEFIWLTTIFNLFTLDVKQKCQQCELCVFRKIN